MTVRTLLFTLFVACLTGTVSAQSASTQGDPATITTVMQVTARDAASVPELKKRVVAVRDFIGKQPTNLSNALMQNANSDQSPNFVGVSQWKSLKDWEALWLNDEFKKLVGAVSKLGNVSPGVFSPVTH